MKIPTNREERITELEKIITKNKKDNHCYKLEIRDLKNAMDFDVEINRVVK